jgi:hypothetical protein
MEIVTGEQVSLTFMAKEAHDHGIADVIWRGAFVDGPADIELFVGDGEVVVEVPDSGFYLIYVGVNGGDMTIRRFTTTAELVAAYWPYGDEAGHDMKIVRMGFQYLGEREPRCTRAYQNLWDPHNGSTPHLQRFALSLEDGPALLFDADHVDAVKVECLPAHWTPTEADWHEIVI